MNKSKKTTKQILAVSEPGILTDDYRPCQGHAGNLESLRRVFADDAACLMECTLNATGERVAVLCASVKDDDGSRTFVPFAILMNGNPYELLTPPSKE